MATTATKATGCTVLIADDEAPFARMIARQLERAGHRTRVFEDGQSALTSIRGDAPDLVLVDVNMPGLSGLELVERLAASGELPPTIVMSAYGNLETALRAVRGGAIDFLSKPFRLPEVELKVEVALERIRQAAPARRKVADKPKNRLEKTDGNELFHNMVGRSEVMRTLFKRIDRVARFDSTVLISGESGTGKELVARAVHEASVRSKAPFVAVNCGAIPESLLESELFGHVRGAFTDATSDRKGLFEQAHGGTLLLDEIVDLPLHLQVKLLRVLQENEVRPVGANKDITIDVRVLAASAVPAAERVRQGRFRQDLFYRLSVIDLHLPALRERIEDIPLLVQFVVSMANRRLGTDITGVHPHAMARLMAHSWPGNVRELQNVIEQACVMSETREIGLSALPERLIAGPDGAGHEVETAGYGIALPKDSLSIPRAVEATERALIEAALERTAGNRTHAARLLEVSQRSLINKIKQYAIDIPGHVGRPPRQ